MDIKGLLHDVKLQTHDLKDQVVIITGSGRGIGKAAAQAFAGLGAQVIIAEIDEQGNQVAEEIVASGGKAYAIQTDVSDQDSISSLKDQVISQLGHVDVLINNATLTPVINVSDMDLETWDEVMRVNLRGTFLTTKAFLPVMLSQNKGIIINMVATNAMPGLSAYMASKQGVSGFTRALASEIADKGLQVIAFAPGMVDTPGIREVAVDVAPKLGLQVDQFLNTPLHAAYDGLMPVEHAGVAAAFLAARLAKRYHGAQVTSYEILEEANLIKPDKSAEAIEKPKMNASTDLVMLLKELQKMIDEMAAEFDEMPDYNQPMARSGFQNKTGVAIEDWKQISSELIIGVQQGKKSHDVHHSLDKDLINLAAYLRGLPGELILFSSDEGYISEMKEKITRRLDVISELIKKVQTV